MYPSADGCAQPQQPHPQQPGSYANGQSAALPLHAPWAAPLAQQAPQQPTTHNSNAGTNATAAAAAADSSSAPPIAFQPAPAAPAPQASTGNRQDSDGHPAGSLSSAVMPTPTAEEDVKDAYTVEEPSQQSVGRGGASTGDGDDAVVNAGASESPRLLASPITLS